MSVRRRRAHSWLLLLPVSIFFLAVVAGVVAGTHSNTPSGTAIWLTQAPSSTQNAAAEDKLQAQQHAIGNAPPTTNSDDLASLVAEWRKSVPVVGCGYNRGFGQGSATVMKDFDAGLGDGVYFVTNKHMITDGVTYFTQTCWLSFPLTTNNPSGGYPVVQTNIRLGTNADWAALFVPKPDAHLSAVAVPQSRRCADRAQIGDRVVILGYPAIGSQSGDITATDGIISSTEGDYYVTSAKVDHGNSGGAAIRVRGDCYLGIPTFVEAGSLESLARILDWNAIFH